MWLQAFCKAARLSVWTVNLISAQKKKQGGREGGGEPRIPDVSQTLRKASPRVYEDTFLVLTVCRCPSRSFTCHKHGVGGRGRSTAPARPPKFTATSHKLLLSGNSDNSWKAVKEFPRHSGQHHCSSPSRSRWGVKWQTLPNSRVSTAKTATEQDGQSPRLLLFQAGWSGSPCRMWRQCRRGPEWANYFLPKREETSLRW